MNKKLTLETWAALDAQASPGPWSAEHYLGGAGEVLRCRPDGGRECHIANFQVVKDAKLCAASRQAPTRLLAALRGLVERLHKAAEGHAENHGERGFCAGLRSGANLLDELIEQTDLSEDAQ